jgi:hypothetical protein
VDFDKLIHYKMFPAHKFLETRVHEALGNLEIENEIFIENPDKIILRKNEK